jgi:hypothetical protein
MIYLSIILIIQIIIYKFVMHYLIIMLIYVYHFSLKFGTGKQILRKRIDREKNIFNSRFTAKTRCTKTNTYPRAGHDGLSELWETICQAQYRPSLSLSPTPTNSGFTLVAAVPPGGAFCNVGLPTHCHTNLSQPPVSILFPLSFRFRLNLRPFREQPIFSFIGSFV